MQQFDFEKKLKVKTTQNVFTIEAKINNNNVKQETHKTKQVLYIVIVDKIVAYTNNYKQENLNSIAQYQQLCVIAKSVFQQ